MILLANQFPCSGCSKLFASERLLRQHVANNSHRFTCSHCPVDEEGGGRCFSNSSHLKEHIDYVHSESRPFPCPEINCNYSAKSKSNLARHIEAHAKKLLYFCEVSSTVFFLMFHQYWSYDSFYAGKWMRVCCSSIRNYTQTRSRSPRREFGAAVRVPCLSEALPRSQISQIPLGKNPQDLSILRYKRTI